MEVLSCICLILIIGVCGTGLLGEVTTTVCIVTGVLGTVTNLTGLGGAFNWDVPGTGAAGVPVATTLTPHPVVIAVLCPVVPICTSLGKAFVLLYPVLYNLPP